MQWKERIIYEYQNIASVMNSKILQICERQIRILPTWDKECPKLSFIPGKAGSGKGTQAKNHTSYS